MTTMFGVYEVRKTSYYEDDGGGSSTHSTLLFIHHDADEIRTTLNKMWENQDLWECRGKYQMAFPEGSMKTNGWWHNGGGCAASGYYEIRPEDSVTLDGFVASLQATIDKEEALRAKRKQEKEEFEERWRLEKLARAEARAKIEREKIRKEQRRKHYAENKDEINAKRRASRAAKSEKLRLEKEAAKKRSDSTYREMRQWLTDNPNHTERQWERAFNRILKKYEDKK